MTSEKILLLGVTEDGVNYSVMRFQENPRSRESGKSWRDFARKEPARLKLGPPMDRITEDDRQCMIDELLELLTSMDIVIIPRKHANIMFSSCGEMKVFLDRFGFKSRLYDVQDAYVCEKQMPWQGDEDHG